MVNGLLDTGCALNCLHNITWLRAFLPFCDSASCSWPMTARYSHGYCEVMMWWPLLLCAYVLFLWSVCIVWVPGGIIYFRLSVLFVCTCNNCCPKYIWWLSNSGFNQNYSLWASEGSHYGLACHGWGICLTPLPSSWWKLCSNIFRESLPLSSKPIRTVVLVLLTTSHVFTQGLSWLYSGQ